MKEERKHRYHSTFQETLFFNFWTLKTLNPWYLRGLRPLLALYPLCHGSGGNKECKFYRLMSSTSSMSRAALPPPLHMLTGVHYSCLIVVTLVVASPFPGALSPQDLSDDLQPGRLEVG